MCLKINCQFGFSTKREGFYYQNGRVSEIKQYSFGSIIFFIEPYVSIENKSWNNAIDIRLFDVFFDVLWVYTVRKSVLFSNYKQTEK